MGKNYNSSRLVNGLYVDSSGKVGIGTTTPNGKLNISNGSEGIEFWPLATTDTNMMQSYNRTTSAWNSMQYKAADHIFFGSASERMRITSSGSVGIGVTPNTWGSSWRPLQMGSYGQFISGRTDDNSMFLGTNTYYNGTNWIATTTGDISQIYLTGANLIFRGVTGITAGAATGFNEYMRILSNGNVLIGTTSDNGSKLNVNGNIYSNAYRLNDTGGGWVTWNMQNSERWSINYLGRFSGYGAGTLTTDGNGFITASSDRNLKDIIKPLENVLDKIINFEPVYFKWNDKTDLDRENVYISTIAQSIEKDFPEAVGKMANGTLTVQDRAVIAILVKSIQELKAEIDILKAK